MISPDTNPRRAWNHLLQSGGYSIGYFSITIENDRVRVYHYRTKEVTYFSKDDSYEGMQQLCRERGYDFPDLLHRHYPKSFRNLAPGTAA